MLQNTLHVFLARLTVAQQHNFQITTLIISAKLCFFVPMLPSLLLPGARDVSAALFIFLTIEWPCGAKKHSLNAFFSDIFTEGIYRVSPFAPLDCSVYLFVFLCGCNAMKTISRLGHFVRRFIVTASGFIFFSSLSRKFFFHVIAGSGKNLQNTRSNYRSII